MVTSEFIDKEDLLKDITSRRAELALREQQLKNLNEPAKRYVNKNKNHILKPYFSVIEPPFKKMKYNNSPAEIVQKPILNMVGHGIALDDMIGFPSEEPVVYYKRLSTSSEQPFKNKFGKPTHASYTSTYDVKAVLNDNQGKQSVILRPYSHTSF